MNVVFHVVAVLVLVVLVWLQNRTQRQRDMLRLVVRLASSVDQAKPIKISWASKFLTEFSLAVGIPLENAIHKPKGQPVKIDQSIFFDFALRCRIVRVELLDLTDDAKYSQLAKISVENKNKLLSEDRAALEKALGIGIKLEG